MSLRRRFVLVFVAFSIALTAVGGVLAWTVARTGIERELDEKLRWVAGAAAEAGAFESTLRFLGPGDEDGVAYSSVYARLIAMRRYVSAAYIFRRDNTAVMATPGSDSIPIGAPLRFLAPYSAELEQAWERGEATTPTFDLAGRPYKYGFVRLRDSDLMLGVLVPADYRAGLERFRRTILLGSIAAALLAALVAGILAAGVTEPIDRLSRSALLIQRGRMDEPVLAEARGEVGRLARAMERMRLGIVQRDESLRLMLAQVAHEIRNPLGGIELLASAAAETEQGEERDRLLGRIRDEVTGLSDIINEFLAFARPSPAERRVHDIRGPVEEAVEVVGAEAARVGRDVAVRLPAEPVLVDADPSHVKSVMLNLIRNAAQAGDRVQVTAAKAGEDVLVTVQDNGPGIDPDLSDRIFDPFVTSKEQGAGLGLAIVRKVAEANGARVEVAPGGSGSPGSGALFKVYWRAPRPSVAGARNG